MTKSQVTTRPVATESKCLCGTDDRDYRMNDDRDLLVGFESRGLAGVAEVLDHAAAVYARTLWLATNGLEGRKGPDAYWPRLLTGPTWPG